MYSINITYTDKKCHNNQHCGQVDGYHCLKIVLLVEVCAVADYVQNNGRNDDIVIPSTVNKVRKYKIK